MPPPVPANPAPSHDPRPEAFTVRPATAGDVDRLVDLLWAVAEEETWLGTEVPFDRHARRSELIGQLAGQDSQILVADSGGTAGVVGNISVVVAPYGVAEVGMLLAETWRGQGLGTALLDAGLAWATEAGAHKANLEVWPNNAAGLALYRSRGFVEEGRRIAHYRRRNGEVWDAIIMGRPLHRP